MPIDKNKRNRVFKVTEEELIRLSAKTTVEALENFPSEVHAVHVLFSALVAVELCEKLAKENLFSEEEDREND